MSRTEPCSIEDVLENPTVVEHIVTKMADQKMNAIGQAICERFGIGVDQDSARLDKRGDGCIVTFPYAVNKFSKQTEFPQEGDLVMDLTYNVGVPQVTVGGVKVDFKEVAARYTELLGNGFSRTIWEITEMPGNAVLGARWDA